MSKEVGAGGRFDIFLDSAVMNLLSPLEDYLSEIFFRVGAYSRGS